MSTERYMGLTVSIIDLSLNVVYCIIFVSCRNLIPIGGTIPLIQLVEVCGTPCQIQTKEVKLIPINNKNLIIASTIIT